MEESRYSDILYWLHRCQEKCPDLRVGQIIENAIPPNSDLFYIDDYVLSKHLREYWESPMSYLSDKPTPPIDRDIPTFCPKCKGKAILKHDSKTYCQEESCKWEGRKHDYVDEVPPT